MACRKTGDVLCLTVYRRSSAAPSSPPPCWMTDTSCSRCFMIWNKNSSALWLSAGRESGRYDWRAGWSLDPLHMQATPQNSTCKPICTPPIPLRPLTMVAGCQRLAALGCRQLLLQVHNLGQPVGLQGSGQAGGQVKIAGVMTGFHPAAFAFRCTTAHKQTCSTNTRTMNNMGCYRPAAQPPLELASFTMRGRLPSSFSSAGCFSYFSNGC